VGSISPSWASASSSCSSVKSLTMSFGGSVELQKAHVSSCISSVIVFTLTFSPRSIIRSPQVIPLLSHQFVWLPGAIVQKNNTPNGDCFFVFFVQLLLLSQSMCN